MNVPIDTLAFAVTKDHLDVRRAEMEVRLVKQIAENGRDISSRLWSTAIGAGIAFLLHAKGL